MDVHTNIIPFSRIRELLKSARAPDLTTKRYDDELLQMTADDGLKVIRPAAKQANACTDISLEITEDMIASTHLWVVEENQAVHAKEQSDFGNALNLRRIKHTNLTGGKPAYVGGEMIWLSEEKIVINGCSGRYGPRSAEEMNVSVSCFAEIGYDVWSMGFDSGTGFPFRFRAAIPVKVA